MMYRLIRTDGVELGVTDRLNYIKYGSSGAFTPATEDEAIGVAFQGIPYNLFEMSEIEDAGTVLISEIDSGDAIAEVSDNIAAVNQAATIAFVTMAEAGTIDDVTAGEHMDAFAEWAYPVDYKAGNIRTYGGKLYRCLQEHKSQVDWTPDVSTSLWAAIADPAEEWPEWSQPVGAHDAYHVGDKVTHGGKHWTCTEGDASGNNVWEPGVYGWTEAEE